MKDLHPTAIFPQATDNQLVPRNVFDRILNSKNGKIGKYKKDIDILIKREINRSLLYSRSSVINRASFVNSAPIVNAYDPSIASQDSIDSMANLLRSEAILPMLFGEESFTPSELKEKINFDSDERGFVALEHLFDSAGLDNVSFYSPSSETIANTRNFFRLYFSQLAAAPSDCVELIGRELLFDRAWNNELRDGLAEDFYKIGDWFNSQRNSPRVDRNEVYKHFLIRDGNVSEGRYGNPRGLNYPYEMKLLLDLKYAANIPDQVNRNILTPENFPSRSALYDLLSVQVQKSKLDLENLTESLGRQAEELLQSSLEYFTVPSLEYLDPSSIYRIRDSEVWERFILIQEKLLRGFDDVDDFLGATSEFPEAFANLQRHIARVTKTAVDDRLKKRLMPTVSIAISLQAGAFTWWITGNPYASGVAGYAGQAIAKALEDHMWPGLKGLAIKMMLQLTPESGKIDQEMSTSIEAVKNQVEISRGSIIDLIGSAEGNAVKPEKDVQLAEVD